MNNSELKRIQAALTYILKEIDRICRKYNIKYSLSSGSLLGAIRHGGMIPWDDDIDICMPRIDYDRFFLVCKNELSNQFRIVSIDNTESYAYGFSKITLRGSKVKQRGLKEGKNTFELWIDIFPYDKVPNCKIKRIKHKYYNYFLVKLLEERYDGLYGKANFIKRVSFGFLHCINCISNPNTIKHLLVLNMKKYNGELSDYITCLSGYYKYDKETLPSNFFENLIEYEFDGGTYYGFSDYDYYLKRIYGDYMKLPPEEKRHTHNLEIIKLEDN